MPLDSLWKLSYDSQTIDILRNSKYAIPLIQSVHLFGITLLLASTVIFNLRLLNLGLRDLPLPVLAASVWRWAKIGLAIAVTSGALVFLPDPARYAANTAFLTKMCLLILASLFQYTVFRQVVLGHPSAAANHTVIAVLSLTLWFAVGWAGRAIAFLG